MASPMPARRGFTLIEVTIASILLSVAVLALMAVIPEVTSLTITNEDSNKAVAACNQVSESIRQYANQWFNYTWRAYNDIASDDPNGSGTAPGNTFDVAGLDPIPGKTRVGSITLFYTNTNQSLESDRDKDGDGKDDRDEDDDGKDDSDKSASNYSLLYFRVSVDWLDYRKIQHHMEVSSQAAPY